MAPALKNAAANDLPAYCAEVAKRAKHAASQLGMLSTSVKNDWLLRSADALLAAGDRVLTSNERDLALAPDFGLTDAAVDRLRLDENRLEAIATGLRQVAQLEDPVGQTIEAQLRPNGLKIEKVRVPLGVVFFIYESRPNVTADAAGICVKSGNAVILRGGKEAAYSSRAIVSVLQEQAERAGIPEHAVQLVRFSEREAVGHFLGMDEWIDVVIPRGGEGLIRRVVAEARMPVIKHYDGNCHVYVDQHAELEMALRIVVNAKTQRMGVCNACESVLVHHAVAYEFLPMLGRALQDAGVVICGDPLVCKAIAGAESATEEDWGREYLGPRVSIRVVESLNQAIEHINHYGSHHTDAIVTRDLAASRRFSAAVDSAAVMVNASTRFNDGGEFGLGAEIGISTDKFHARGPCGLRELTSYKYVVTGDGHVRE